MVALHVNIDVQKLYRVDDEAFREVWPNMTGNIVSLTKLLGDMNVPTFFYASSQEFKMGLASDPQIMAFNNEKIRRNLDLAIDFDATLLRNIGFKNVASIYQDVQFRKYAEKRGVDTLVLSGLCECTQRDLDRGRLYWTCLSATAYDFATHGYRVIVAAEATNKGVSGTQLFSRLRERRRVHEALGAEVLPIVEIVSEFSRAGFCELGSLKRDQERSRPSSARASAFRKKQTAVRFAFA